MKIRPPSIDCQAWSRIQDQNTGNLTRAAQLFDAALRLAPDSAEMRQAIVWLFIDSNDNISLRKLLATHEAEWSGDKEMHDDVLQNINPLCLKILRR